MRVTGQLIDASTGAHVWSERWDRPAADVFAVQTEVAEKVASALGGDLTMGQITRAELERAKRLRPNDLTAYDYFQLARNRRRRSRTSIKGSSTSPKLSPSTRSLRAHILSGPGSITSRSCSAPMRPPRSSGCSPTPKRR